MKQFLTNLTEIRRGFPREGTHPDRHSQPFPSPPSHPRVSYVSTQRTPDFSKFQLTGSQALLPSFTTQFLPGHPISGFTLYQGKSTVFSLVQKTFSSSWCQHVCWAASFSKSSLASFIPFSHRVNEELPKEQDFTIVLNSELTTMILKGSIA